MDYHHFVFMTHIRHRTQVWALLAALMLGAFCFAASYAGAQTSCDYYQSNVAPPQGYGAAWNPLSSGKELLLKTTCRTGAADYTVGIGNQNHYIFNKGYIHANGAWQQFTYNGTSVQGSTSWLQGTGTYTYNNPPAGTNYWAAYLCQWNATTKAWYCGCNNAECQTQNWQLQSYTVTAPSTGGTTGGSTTGGTTGGGGGGGWYEFPAGQVFSVPTSQIASSLISPGTYANRYNLMSEQDISTAQASQILSNPLSSIFSPNPFGNTLGVTVSNGDLRLVFYSGGLQKTVRLTDGNQVAIQWTAAGMNGTLSQTAALEAFVLDHFIISTRPIQTNLY